MRLEAIEKEADLYRGEHECYVHIEKVEGAEDIKCVANGGKSGLSLAAYVLCLHVAEEIGTKPTSLWRFYKSMYKKHGMPPKHELMAQKGDV